MTDQQVRVPGAPSPVPALPNLRDLGGWPGADGRTVRYGVLFRSADFRSFHDDEAGIAALPAALGLRTVYDFRSAVEIDALPDPVWDEVAAVHLDVLADTSTAVPANLATVLGDPEAVPEINEFLAGHEVLDKMRDTYRELVSADSARRSYARFYRGVLGEDQSPALFHCTTGKDRTGWAAAALLSLLGVSRDDVFHDYLLTNERLLPSLEPVFGKFTDAGGRPELLVHVLGVREDYLEASFDEVDAAHGSIEAYFADGLGIDAQAQAALRDRYLES